MNFQKPLFDTLHFTTACFSNISLIVIPSNSNIVGGITYILFTACFTTQQVNQIFIVAFTSMVYFISFFSGDRGEFFSNIYFLQAWHLQLPNPWHPTFLSTGYKLDLIMMRYFIFLAPLCDTTRGGEKTFWTSQSLYEIYILYYKYYSLTR